MPAIPNSGAISLSDFAAEFGGTAPHSMSEYYRDGGNVPSNNTNVPTSGAFRFGQMRGAINAIIQTLANTTNVDLSTVFGSDWASTVPKEVIIPSGVTIGGTGTSDALTAPSGMGGTLTITNAGSVIGFGGTAGGNGGNAIRIASTGITVNNSGLIAGGGGAGGNGGTGGIGGAGGTGGSCTFYGNFVQTNCGSVCGCNYITASCDVYCSMGEQPNYLCYQRVQTAGGSGGTGGSGGAGGSGGNGIGYNQVASNGTAGSSGSSGSNGGNSQSQPSRPASGGCTQGGGAGARSTGAGGAGGAGGTGGSGGNGATSYGTAGSGGANGNTGSSGSSGGNASITGQLGCLGTANSGSAGSAGSAGTSGSAGGNAGAAVIYTAAYTMNNTGTLAGAA